jgi:hypothetical protein
MSSWFMWVLYEVPWDIVGFASITYWIFGAALQVSLFVSATQWVLTHWPQALIQTMNVSVWYLEYRCEGLLWCGFVWNFWNEIEWIVKIAVSIFVIVWFLLYMCSKHYKFSLSIISIMCGKMMSHNMMWIWKEGVNNGWMIWMVAKQSCLAYSS